MRKHHVGLSLIELLIVVVIVGILTAMAVPSYRQYMIRTNRTEAKTTLMQVAAALERCYTTVSSYDPADGCGAVTNRVTDGGHYAISATVLNRTAFTLTATPQGPQANDTPCGSFRLNQRNERTVSGAIPAVDCWGR